MRNQNHYSTQLINNKLLLLCFCLSISSFYCIAQTENTFVKEVKTITAKYDTIWDTEEIIRRIKTSNSSTQIILIAAKPSISRWKIRGKYKSLNRKFERLAKKDAQIDYVDVWHPMLNDRKLKTDIFIEDGLHMNQKGYDIWYEAMKNFVNNP